MLAFPVAPDTRRLLAIVLALIMAGCSSSGGGSSTTTPPPAETNITGRIHPLGTEITDAQEVIVYAHALDENNAPLSATELQELLEEATLCQNSSVTPIGSESEEATFCQNGSTTLIGPELIEVTQLTDGAQPLDPTYSATGKPLVSLSFITDYSYSMPEESLRTMEVIYTAILDNLPQVFQAQVIDYSQNFRYRTTASGNAAEGTLDPIVDPPIFTGDLETLRAAVKYIPDPKKDDTNDPTRFRTASALYNALGTAFFGPREVQSSNSGLFGECTPVHAFILSSDGENRLDQGSNHYTLDGLVADIETHRAFPVVLATETTVSDLETLKTIAARGIYIYNPSLDAMTELATNYARSLGNIVRIRIDTTGLDIVRPIDRQNAALEIKSRLSDTPLRIDLQGFSCAPQ